MKRIININKNIWLILSNFAVYLIEIKMNLQEKETHVQTNHKLQLVDGEFTATEAFDVINNLINEKINFHKINRLQIFEQDHGADTEHLSKRITELSAGREDLREFILKAKQQGLNVRINGVIEISLSEA